MWLTIGLVGSALAFAPGRVTNTRTGTPYTTVSAALAAATPGDRLWVDGVYAEHVVVDRDVVLDGAPGAEIGWESGTEVVLVNFGVSLTIRAVDLVSTSCRALRAEGANALTVAGSTVQGAAVGQGGGLQLTDPAAVTLADVTFEGTTATATGGAISVSSSASFPMALTDVVFRGTSAGTNGGALALAFTDLSCTRCVFDGTSATSGGAIWDGGLSTIEVRGSTFTGTTAAVSGGAIAVSATTTDLTVEQSTFCRASANSGGALSGAPATATVRASTFVEGTAGGVGAAIHATGGTWVVHNDHFLGNAGGPAVKAANAATTMAVVNALFLNNADFGIDGNGASVTVSYSDLFGNTNDLTGASVGLGNVFVDPVLRAWSADGDCANDDLRPDWTSPLVDAGDPAVALRDPDGTRSDIGAFGGPASDPANHTDGDGDGVRFFRDCDDEEAAAHFGAAEVCDGVDNDCDGGVDVQATDEDSFYQDCDRDGQGDVATRVDQCFAPTTGVCPWVSYATLGEDAWSDCDDRDPTVYWGADELCDLGDQNCDGDDFLGATDADPYYADTDLDGWGGALVYSCLVSPPGLVTTGGDCNDAISAIHPGAADPCEDGFDSDCNGFDGTDADLVDWYPDLDADGFGDIDGLVERDCVDRSGSGWTSLAEASDCDDALDAVHPGAEEVCNLVDDDCDDTVDDVAGDPVEWFEDHDLDGYGDRRFPFLGACSPAEGWIAQGQDCDDDDDQVHPGVPEICNRVDDDCDDRLDADDPDAVDTVERWPDADGDGYGACDGGSTCPPEPLCPDEVDGSWADNAEDCMDGVDAVHPGAVDVPGDDLDQDCSGSAEPGPEPEPEPDPKGCGCDAAPGAPALGGLLPLLLALALRRRSSRAA